MFLARTIEDILENIEGKTEIIAVLDGAWADPPIKDRERVNLIYHPISIGQRAATNEAARISQAKYVMKCDAHCSFDQGFDVKMLNAMQPTWTMVPTMYNLHAFDWVCQKCDKRRYQGPTPDACPKCGGQMEREVLWKAKRNPESTAMRFDRDLKFQYWGGYKKRQDGDLVDTMSILGACWMLERERYHELNICDEKHGSWGQQGTEVACKTWLSGGRLVCNKRTWFAHMFRTQGGDFGFPYPISGGDTRKARRYSQELWRAENPDEMPLWDKAIHPLSWLIEKFAPVPGWEQELTKGIIYYTDNRLEPQIMSACQQQLKKSDLPIVSASLKPLGFGENVTLDAERGPLTMFRQILAALEACEADVVFFAEHDVMYHPSHFEFVPERKDLFYYNNNVWKVDAETGRALFHYSNHTSQLCAYRDLLLEHYHKRVELVEQNGFSRRMGFEPGTHGRKERVDDYKCKTWMSEVPNLDLRHKHNLTQTRWRKDQFRNQRYTKGWTIADKVPGWGQTRGRMEVILNGLSE
jgi:hypothetical protein